jgi:gamma-glutamyl:cysteine ligase YbdK (ATP-grasp superfamily)
MNLPARPLGAFAACGIELEYMIVDRDTLDVMPIADVLMRKAAGSYAATFEEGRIGWSNELTMHVVEIKNTAPQARLDQLDVDFQDEVRRIDELLVDSGARLMPGAMHPWMDPLTETQLWPGHGADIYRSYDRIFDCRAHGWANIQSMHVNLPFAGDAEFARLHAAVRVLLPILPALAASSPVADGRIRTELDFRMACYRLHPARVPSLIGRVVPENSVSRAEYEATILGPMYREIAPLDPAGLLRHEWLNARGTIPRFDRNALEIRVIDMQECPQADMAVAGLTSAVARALFTGRWSTLDQQRDIATGSLAAILETCTRDADRALIDNGEYLSLLGLPSGRCEARELWRHLIEACTADPLLSQVSPAPLENILSRGPLARRIVRALGPRFDRLRLAFVYRELCDCLAEGRLFIGHEP